MILRTNVAWGSPLPSLKRPRFSFPVEDEEEEDFPLYRRPETKQTQSDAASQENQSPASSQEGPSSSSSSSSSSSLQQSHTAPAPIPGNLQLQQKLAKRETMSSFMRKGYNGLGGHSKFRLPVSNIDRMREQDSIQLFRLCTVQTSVKRPSYEANEFY